RALTRLDMSRRVVRYGRELDNERLVRGARFLLADVRDRLVGKVLGQVIALLGRSLRMDRRRAVVERGRVLAGLSTDEPVEVLESRTRRPVVVWPNGGRLEDWHLVTLAELRGQVPVKLEDLGQRCAGGRPQGVVARRGRGDLSNPSHADGVVIAA